MDIKELIADSHGTAKDKGWWDKGLTDADGFVRPKSYPTTLCERDPVAEPDKANRIPVELLMTKLMLAQGELHEAGEEIRANHAPMDVYWRDPRTDSVIPNSTNVTDEEAAVLLADGFKPEGFSIEVADCIIRLADLCGLLGIDLEKALALKQSYNTKRPYRHGGKAV